MGGATHYTSKEQELNALLLQSRANLGNRGFVKVLASRDSNLLSAESAAMNKSTKDHDQLESKQTDSGSSVVETRLSKFEFSAGSTAQDSLNAKVNV